VEDNDEVSESEINWENTNKLLDKGFKGVKTGITPAAGACLSALYE
jgi:D-alanyl-D-alanine carboxypeptidase